jgi:hypothetical protein
VTTDQEPLGSAAEEATRLFTALQDWARRNGVRLTPGSSLGNDDAADPHPAWADGSASCRICPLCQLIALTREASPEVVDHLSSAADSLLAAARAALLAHERQRSGTEHVEWIDIG